jgi:hypothetical protein
MTPFKLNTLWAAIGGVVVALAIALLSPDKLASAAYSTPVGLFDTNTTAVPATMQDALTSFSTSLILNTSAGIGTDSSIVVPAGKRLVIEYISAQGATDAGQRIQDILVKTTTPGKGGVLGTPTLGVYPAQIGTLNNRPNWAVSQPILGYADAGIVTVQADITGGSPAGVFVTLSGHFVNIQ